MNSNTARLQSEDYQTKVSKCLHCGLCLSACPTYAISGREAQSPRGRIALMRAVADGHIELSATTLTEHLDSCLACRACASACPSGVQYGALIEETHIAISHSRKPGRTERFVRWMGLRQLMPHVGRLKLMARALWLYQRSGLQGMVRGLNVLPETLKAMEAIIPPLAPRHRNYQWPMPAIAPKRGRVAFLYGCVQEAFLAQVNDATIRVLRHNGYEVVVPAAQTCCGAAQLHSGDEEQAFAMARQNIDALLAEDVDAIISNAGGCGFSLKEYPHLLRNDPVYHERAKAFVAKVYDISEFLAKHEIIQPQGEVRARVTYVDSCHLRNGQKVVNQPRDLLRRIAGLELVELSQPDRCCGSAGIYNITHPATANEILDAKMADIAATGANLIVVSNTGCHLQIIAGVRKAGVPARVMHIVEVLNQAYRGATPHNVADEGTNAAAPHDTEALAAIEIGR